MLLHIDLNSHRFAKPWKTFSNSICQAPLSEQEVYEEFITGTGYWNPGLSEPKGFLKFSASMHQHANCLESRGGGPVGLHSFNPMNLSLLLVCRQVYQEAQLVPLKKNTFAFEDPDTLEQFILRIPAAYEPAVRSVQFDILLDSMAEYRKWNAVIRDDLIPYLTNIQNLDICIDLGNYSCFHDAASMAHPEDVFMPGLFSLQGLPLTSITVIIRDCEVNLPWTFGPGYRWHLVQKKRWAMFIRNRILGMNEDDPRILLPLPALQQST